MAHMPKTKPAQVHRFVFLLAYFFALFVPSSAFAIRVSSFVGAAQNVIISNKVKEPVDSSCIITITNVSSVQQSVRFSIKLYAVASGGTATSCTVNGLDASCSGTGADNQHGTTITNLGLGLADPLVLANASASPSAANCTAASNTCTLPLSGNAMNFPMIKAGQIITQNVRCEGRIEVDNATAGSPGFVVASGSLVTFVESLAGAALTFAADGTANGTGKNNTTAPTFTPIMIGEGRPF